VNSVSPNDSIQARFFEAWARLMLAHRFLFLFISVAITIFFAVVCVQLPLMTTLRDFLDPNGVGMVEWEEARDRFGGDESIFYAVKSDDHFSPQGLERMRRVVDKIEGHIFVDRVLAFTTAQELRTDPDDPDSILIEPFVREGVSPASIKKSLLADTGLAKHLVNHDGSGVMVMVQLIPNENDVAQQPEILAEVNRRIANMRGIAGQMKFDDGPRRVLELAKGSVGEELFEIFVTEGYSRSKIYAGGFSMLLISMLKDADRNLTVLFPITVLILFLTLLALFRRFSDAVLPLVCVGPAVIWSVGIGGLIFGRLTIVTSMVPVMVLVVGISDVVHLVTQYRHELARGHPQELAIRISFREVGAACALTSLTTFIGFGSMIFLPLQYAKELGVFAGLGVVNAFVVSFIFTPIFLSFKKPKDDTEEQHAHDFLFRMLERLNDILIPRPKVMLCGGVILSCILGILLTQVEVENSLTRKLSKDHPMRVNAELLDREFGGSGDMEILIDTQAPDGLLNPKTFKAMYELSEWINKNESGCSAFSLVDLIKSMHVAMNPDSPQDLPSSREAIAQYLLLFEMSGGEDLDALLDATRQHTRMTVRMNDRTGEEVVALGERIQKQANLMFPQGVGVSPNGLGLQSARLAPVLLSMSLQGFGSAMLLIAILMGLLFRTVRVAVLCLLPNVVPVAVGILAIYALMEQFDADGLSYVSICIGVAVDDTIHLLSRYRLERQRGLQRDAAVRATVLEAGHGIVRTSVILILGFGVLWFADYQPVKTMGLMLPTTMLAAVLLDLTVVPAMAQLGLLEPKIQSEPAV